MAVLAEIGIGRSARTNMSMARPSVTHIQNISRGGVIIQVPTVGARLAGQEFSLLDMSGKKFYVADLERSLFVRSILKGTRFVAADLSDADLSFCQGNGASFMDALVAGARFDNAFLHGADFRGARGIPAFTGADMRDAMLPGKWHDLLKYGGFGTGIRNFDRIIWAG
jgi:uncharacterized protein YjbI with pentapeptide repeats